MFDRIKSKSFFTSLNELDAYHFRAFAGEKQHNVRTKSPLCACREVQCVRTVKGSLLRKKTYGEDKITLRLVSVYEQSGEW
jgi:hypothetical protein